MRKDKLAYILFLLSSLLLIGIFLHFGKSEGYIISEFKWTFFGLAMTVNLIFLAVSILRFILKKSIKTNELLLTILGITPMIILLIYVKILY